MTKTMKEMSLAIQTAHTRLQGSRDDFHFIKDKLETAQVLVNSASRQAQKSKMPKTTNILLDIINNLDAAIDRAATESD